jgi:hypothetical protein
LLDLGRQTTVTTDGDGHIASSAVNGLNGQPLEFEEIAPFLWREINGHTLIAAKVAAGKVVMWSDDEQAPTGVLLPTPATRNAGWLVPLIILSLAVLLSATVQWPIGALIRRRYAASLPYQGTVVRTRRWALIGGASSLVLVFLWFSTLAWIVGSFSFTSALDPWIRVLQLLSVVIFPAAALAALWNAWTASRELIRGHTLRWLWSLLIAVSCLSLLYAAVTFGLIGFSVAL